MKIGTSRSPKLGALAASLGITKRDALGLLSLLWEWGWEQAPRGDVGRWRDEDIAEACGETPERGAEVVAALVDAGWLDLDSEHRLVVHDYAEHCPEFVRKRLSRKDLRPLVGGDGAERQPTPAECGAERRTDGGRTAAERPTEERRGEKGREGGTRAPACEPPSDSDPSRSGPEENPHQPDEQQPAELRTVSDPPAEAVAKAGAILDEARGAPAENKPPRRVIERLTDRARRLGVGAVLSAARAYAADEHVSTAGKSLGQLDAEWDKWSAEARKGGGPRGEMAKTLRLGSKGREPTPLTPAELKLKAEIEARLAAAGCATNSAEGRT